MYKEAKWKSELKHRHPQLSADHDIDVGEGWRCLVESLYGELAAVLAKAQVSSLRMRQVKSKLGLLRVYYDPGDLPEAVKHLIDTRVQAAGAAATRICEQCGAVGQLRASDTGVLHTACDAHKRAGSRSPARQPFVSDLACDQIT